MARPSSPKVKPEPATANTAGLAAGPTVGRTAEPSPAAGAACAAPGRVSPVQVADLARLAGVSVSTVSRALSNSPLVNATVGDDNRLGGRLATAHLLASAAQLANAFSTVGAGRVMVKGPAGESSCEAVVPMVLAPKRRSPGE